MQFLIDEGSENINGSGGGKEEGIMAGVDSIDRGSKRRGSLGRFKERYGIHNTHDAVLVQKDSPLGEGRPGIDDRRGINCRCLLCALDRVQVPLAISTVPLTL